MHSHAVIDSPTERLHLPRYHGLTLPLRGPPFFATRQLNRVHADITLIDRQNYHLFQPLLYQVATAGLAPSDIAWPIRGILSGQKNVTVLLDQVCDVNLDTNEVVTKDRTLPFDYLILATGVRHAYFGHENWEPHAPGLKSMAPVFNKPPAAPACRPPIAILPLQ